MSDVEHPTSAARPTAAARSAVGDRLILVATSPRLPAGVLSWPGWEALRSGPVYATEPDSPQARAVRAAGIEVSALPAAAGTTQPGFGELGEAGGFAEVGEVASLDGAGQLAVAPAGGGERARAVAFRDLARGGRVAVWLAGPDGEPAFAQALGDLVAREGGAELEVVYGSWDPPGARLLDVVSTMDRLRSPGGCPWDAQQTHESLMPYLLEEAYEAYQALEDGDLTALREELGDVLLQVVFHSRLAQEAPAGPADAGDPLSGVDQQASSGGGWSIDDVAGDLVDKLIRRHPHVFAGVAVSGADEVHANWQEIKRAEKRRTSVTEGVPLALPALLLATTLQRKATQAGLPDRLEPLEAAGPAGPAEPVEPTESVDRPARTDEDTAREFGYQLFELVRAARVAGVDPEAALRAVSRRYRDLVVAAERQRAAGEVANTGDLSP